MEINNELERVAMTTYPVVVLFLFKRKFLKTERKISTPGVPPGICQNHQYCDIFDSKKKLTSFGRRCFLLEGLVVLFQRSNLGEGFVKFVGSPVGFVAILLQAFFFFLVSPQRRCHFLQFSLRLAHLDRGLHFRARFLSILSRSILSPVHR